MTPTFPIKVGDVDASPLASGKAVDQTSQAGHENEDDAKGQDGQVFFLIQQGKGLGSQLLPSGAQVMSATVQDVIIHPMVCVWVSPTIPGTWIKHVQRG